MRIIDASAQITSIPEKPLDTLKLIEACGRVCYKSEGSITEDSYKPFILKVLERGHEAVLEHGNIIFSCDYTAFICLTSWFNRAKNEGITLYLRFTSDGKRYVVSGNVRAWRDTIRYILGKGEALPNFLEGMIGRYNPLFSDFAADDLRFNAHGTAKEICALSLESRLEFLTHACVSTRFVTDRGVTHEIVRHRPASYCQESTRYCNYSKEKFGDEITVIKPFAFKKDSLEYDAWYEACRVAELEYMGLLAREVAPQWARSVLPNSLKTEIVMTATVKEWLHFFSLRCAEAAHPQMREVATQAREQMEQRQYI